MAKAVNGAPKARGGVAQVRSADSRKHRAWLWWAVPVAVLVAVIGVLAMPAEVYRGRPAEDHPLHAMAKRVPTPTLPERGKPDPSPDGSFTVERVRFSGTGPGGEMDLWLYLPSPGTGTNSGKGDGSSWAPRSLPCVLIPPAGSRCIDGMGLGDGDSPEHLPYIKAGFAVVAFSLDGDSDAVGARKAIPQFQAAAGGVVNVRNALAFVEARVPEVDTGRVAIAGHSSAGTVALYAMMGDSRLRAAVAYAPATDIKQRLDNFAGRLLMGLTTEDSAAYLDALSPIRHIDYVDRPVFLFVADDDDVTGDEVKAFASEMAKHRKPHLTYVTVKQGGHYDAMIKDGIPRGIAFLKEKLAVR